MSDDPSNSDPKARLIMAAEEVFAEKGFKAATVREIIEKAGMNIAAVNYYFGDKEQLYIATCKYAHSCSAPQALPDWPEGTPPAVKLADFIRIMVQGMATPTRPTSLTLMMRELSNPTEAARQIVQDYIQPMAFMLRGILREMYPTANEHRLLMVGFSIIGQCLYYRQNRAVSDLIFGPRMGELPVDAISDHITRFSLAALGHAEPIREILTPLPLREGLGEGPEAAKVSDIGETVTAAGPSPNPSLERRGVKKKSSLEGRGRS